MSDYSRLSKSARRRCPHAPSIISVIALAFPTVGRQAELACIQRLRHYRRAQTRLQAGDSQDVVGQVPEELALLDLALEVASPISPDVVPRLGSGWLQPQSLLSKR